MLVLRIKTLKIETFGHDCVVLHEADIRRKRGAFSMLSKESRETFLEMLTTIIEDLPMTVVAVVIDKRKLNEQYSTPYNLHHLGTEYGLEGLRHFLRMNAKHEAKTRVVFRAR